MSLCSPRAAFVLAIAAASVLLGGCVRLRAHEGYIVDLDLVNSVQPGVDNRDSVAKVLGKPSFTSQFDDDSWYYVSRDTRHLAYNNPKPNTQITLRIQFNDKGVVSRVDKTGLEQVASITPNGDKTPTLGRRRTFFQDLFGNIGAVGAGAGGPGGGGAGGPNSP
ncbi:MAG: outer membrane protein assembly factor BamE [Sphingomonas sp.]|jgi:outer membrane protein assembly factor BamE (lipoprotein component of BamABCDE complex)